MPRRVDLNVDTTATKSEDTTRTPTTSPRSTKSNASNNPPKAARRQEQPGSSTEGTRVREGHSQQKCNGKTVNPETEAGSFQEPCTWCHLKSCKSQSGRTSFRIGVPPPGSEWTITRFNPEGDRRLQSKLIEGLESIRPTWEQPSWPSPNAGSEAQEGEGPQMRGRRRTK